MPKSFVYVYEMPSKFTSDILDLPTIWHPEQYDIDQVQYPYRSAMHLKRCYPAFYVFCAEQKCKSWMQQARKPYGRAAACSAQHRVAAPP